MISKQDLIDMQRRIAAARKMPIAAPTLPAGEPLTAAPMESDLHGKIKEHCQAQWPRWKAVSARMDKKSTLPVGCQDFTIFADKGRVFCFECKAKGKKPDADQLIWHKEMAMLGHKVHIIWTFEEFKEIVK